jgi:hypothetical protein
LPSPSAFCKPSSRLHNPQKGTNVWLYSGCICAAGRVGSSRSLLDSDDGSYDASAPFLWALSEMTCALLVFCAPVVPKVLNSSVPLTQLAHSLRSWTRIGRTQGSDHSGGSGRSGRSKRSGRSANENVGLEAEPSAYRKLEDPSKPMPLTTISHAKSKPMPLSLMKSPSDYRPVSDSTTFQE